MRTPQRTRLLFCAVVSALTSNFISAGAWANDQPDKTKQDGAEELRVTIPGGDNNTTITENDIRSQLLSEKLIKMGRSKSQSCTRCHGRTGMATLANVHGWEHSVAEFVVKQLTELREGKRAHAVMSSIAAPLSDQDIALIAAWYQSVSPDSDADK